MCPTCRLLSFCCYGLPSMPALPRMWSSARICCLQEVGGLPYLQVAVLLLKVLEVRQDDPHVRQQLPLSPLLNQATGVG